MLDALDAVGAAACVGVAVEAQREVQDVAPRSVIGGDVLRRQLVARQDLRFEREQFVAEGGERDRPSVTLGLPDFQPFVGPPVMTCPAALSVGKLRVAARVTVELVRGGVDRLGLLEDFAGDPLV